MESSSKDFKYDVYCQVCGKDITQLGAIVTNNRKAYCNQQPFTNNRCFDAAFDKNASAGRITLPDYCSAEKVQQEIEDGELTEYGKLEKGVR